MSTSFDRMKGERRRREQQLSLGKERREK